ncbi:MAG: sodium:proton antiporter, partial [Oscillospiraceae bacterium]|nr:sodium:proton antiporter [Oscillospiraceae bacterium]
MLVLAMITMATGAVLGVFSVNLKRTLACSSMSQIGFILTGVAMSELLGEESAGAVHGLVLHMLNHSLFKLTLFLAAGAVFMNLHELELNKIRGFGRGKPVLSFAMLMGLCGLAGIPGGSGYVSKTLLHESIVEYVEVLEHAGLQYGAYRAAEWVFLVSGGLTLAYMLKLFLCVCVEKNADAATQKRYDSMNGRWCTKVSAGILLLCAALIPLLGCTVYLSMDRIAALADAFFRVEPGYHRVHYFTLGNLKGSAISIGIGVLVYLLFVRRVLMKNGAYLDRWPAALDLEERIYRPLLLQVLPFLGALAARTVSTLPEVLRKAFCALLYRANDNGFVFPRENDRFTVYEQSPEGTRGFGASLAYSLLMFSMGLVVILVFLFLQ